MRHGQTPADTLVTVDGVSLFLPGDARQEMVLHDIRLVLHKGEHCALIGPNGSGKSTLLKLLAGELWPASGHIYWHTAEGREESPLAGRGMTSLVSPAQQLLYQKRGWTICGMELLLAGFDGTPLLYTASSDAQKESATAMARRLDALPLLERSIASLSQGQLRLLLLCRALLRKPSLLLLDECTDGLDSTHRRGFLDRLADVAKECAIVMASHRHDLIPRWCDACYSMQGGRLSPLSASRPTGAPFSRPAVTGMEQANARCETGFPMRKADKASAEGQILIALIHATVFIDGEEILHDICWTMKKGENWLISGENGSGKSTFLRLLAGDEFAAFGGSAERFPSEKAGSILMLEEIRRRIRLVSDLSQVLYDYPLSSLELVCTGFDNSTGVYRTFTHAEQSWAEDAIRRFFPGHEANAIMERPFSRLSTGQQRRLFLARALAGNPDILLLDEPTSGLDEQSRADYTALLDRLTRRQSCSHSPNLVFVTHHAGDLPRCINRQASMRNGRLTILT
ncbi:MAG: ATP-binding cassette domain-containing protein [Desulfovibrio sp.]|nr:ATP-binding cassette domain-containing protein [Desulfovibrio sp.]